MWGGILALLGLGVAGYAGTLYDFGSLRRMGPGFFPVVLGLSLAALGLVIAIPALNRAGKTQSFAWRETVGIVGAVLLFGLFLERLGIVVTTAGTLFLATLVAPRGGIAWRLVLTLAVTGLTWALFILGLNMAIPVWPWST